MGCRRATESQTRCSTATAAVPDEHAGMRRRGYWWRLEAKTIEENSQRR